ncbi:MAG: hypothetical protein ACJ71B_07620 [Nitrososphaera sp.]
MEWYGVVLGAVAGLLGTIVMCAIEIVPWRKWGLQGVFEWHENQMLIVKFFKLENSGVLHYPGIFGLHFLNGMLGGIGFYLAVELVDYLSIVPLPILGIAYSLFLWVVTLVPIHKPITGLHPWGHPLGHGPALASLGGHIAYGIALSIFFSGFL